MAEMGEPEATIEEADPADGFSQRTVEYPGA
jgi:hypothetical protein